MEIMTTLEKQIQRNRCLLESDPGNIDLMLTYAHDCLRRDLRFEALTVFQKVAEQKESVQARFAIAKIFYMQKLYEEAYDELKLLFDIDSDNIDGHILLHLLKEVLPVPECLQSRLSFIPSRSDLSDAAIRIQNERDLYRREVLEYENVVSKSSDEDPVVLYTLREAQVRAEKINDYLNILSEWDKIQSENSDEPVVSVFDAVSEKDENSITDLPEAEEAAAEEEVKSEEESAAAEESTEEAAEELTAETAEELKEIKEEAEPAVSEEIGAAAEEEAKSEDESAAAEENTEKAAEEPAAETAEEKAEEAAESKEAEIDIPAFEEKIEEASADAAENTEAEINAPEAENGAAEELAVEAAAEEKTEDIKDSEAAAENIEAAAEMFAEENNAEEAETESVQEIEEQAEAEEAVPAVEPVSEEILKREAEFAAPLENMCRIKGSVRAFIISSDLRLAASCGTFDNIEEVVKAYAECIKISGNTDENRVISWTCEYKTGSIILTDIKDGYCLAVDGQGITLGVLRQRVERCKSELMAL